jgi:hypothetical protein
MSYALAVLINSAPAKQGIPHAMKELVNTNDTLSLHLTEVSCTASEARKTEASGKRGALLNAFGVRSATYKTGGLGLASSTNDTQYWLMMKFNRLQHTQEPPGRSLS